MLKRMRAAHPFLYCILAVVLFLAVMRAGTTLFVLVLTLLAVIAATVIADAYRTANGNPVKYLKDE